MKEFVQEGINTKKELGEEEKSILESFNQIQFPSLRAKIDTLLVWRKFKPGTAIDLSPESSKEEVANILKIMTTAGIYSKVVTREKPKSGPLRKILFIANNRHDLEQLSKLYFGDHLKNSQILGKIFGYPATAIEAFDKSNQLSEEEAKRYRLTLDEIIEKLKPENIRPIFFILSRQNADKEITVMKKWMEEIKFLDLSLYEQINTQGDDGAY